MLVVQRLFFVTACVGVIAPRTIHAQEPMPPAVGQRSTVLDVALQAGGTLRGQVVNRQGIPIESVTVSIRVAGKEIAQAKADGQGRFGIRRLRGGLHTVACNGTSWPLRVWAEGTAPPSANPSVMLVYGQAARGQAVPHPARGGSHVSRNSWGHAPSGHVHSGPGGIRGVLTRYPLAVGTGVAAAIALPLALDDDPLDLPEE